MLKIPSPNTPINGIEIKMIAIPAKTSITPMGIFDFEGLISVGDPGPGGKAPKGPRSLQVWRGGSLFLRGRPLSPCGYNGRGLLRFFLRVELRKAEVHLVGVGLNLPAIAEGQGARIYRRVL
mgnify:CR=1 FL=1